MLMTMRKVLSFPFSSTHSGIGGGGSDSVSPNPDQMPVHKGKLPIDQIKKRMELALHGATGTSVGGMVYKIRSARNVSDLWMLRSDMYQVIAMEHNQSEAARRINSLLPCFSQWIAAKQLSAI
jgi:hypothetical protein